ncbi:MAG: hypothetical protein E7653_01485 [Ruminococcaceae bacterium]|nr:hypothetical protein [Oscillospiraceae bacterium]
MKNKIFKWVLRILIALVILVLFALAAFSLGERLTFLSFYSNAEAYQKMPGIFTGYTHQGYTLVKDKNMRLACGYMSNDEASRIYIMPEGSNDYTFVELKNADGSDYTGHTGGIDVYGKYVYITAETGCDLFLFDDVMDGDGVATLTRNIPTFNDPAYCEIKDDVLYVGTFYHAGTYETPASYHMTTPAGDKNTAIITAYDLDPATGLPKSDTPFCIYSTTSFVQGMTFTDDQRIILATSYGLSKSHLLIYDIDKIYTSGTTLEVNGVNVPVMYLDSDCLAEDIIAPPMAEEIIYEDGTIYIMNESASNKYVFGHLTSGRRVYGYKLK